MEILVVLMTQGHKLLILGNITDVCFQSFLLSIPFFYDTFTYFDPFLIGTTYIYMQIASGRNI